LPDQQTLASRWSAAVRRSRRQGSQLGLLLINLSGLDRVTDLPGRPERQRTIELATRVLLQCTRGEDIPARLSSGELALAASYWDAADLLAIAGRVSSAFHAASESLGVACTMRFGVGASGEAQLDQLVAIASLDLARSLENGGDQVRI
jgi:GGDEF domain-containing protein